MHIEFPGAGTISRRDTITFSYKLIDITTGGTLAFLNGNAGDQTNVVANIYNTAADYSFREARI